MWDACSALINAQTGQRVKVNAVYRKQSYFTKVAGVAAKSIQLLSHELYDVPFPYPVMTVFDGGPGGMEFPMIVNDQPVRNNRGVIGLSTHEIAHTYFPYYVGTNEQKNAWLDEGLTSYITEKANEYYDTAAPLSKVYKPAETFPAARAYNNWMGSDFDVPMMVPSIEMNLSYRGQVYQKSSAAYHFMEEFLGKELFTKAMKEFMYRWNGKHPVPTDFFFTFNDVCKQDLSWFFKPWFYEMGVADLALENASVKTNHLKVDIHRKGILPVPVILTVKFEDGSDDVILAHTDIWKNGNTIYKVDKKYSKQITKLILGNDYIPDNSKEDNTLEFK
jgi:aminopeptidase N